jgi:hypothetical protein
MMGQYNSALGLNVPIFNIVGHYIIDWLVC